MQCASLSPSIQMMPKEGCKCISRTLFLDENMTGFGSRRGMEDGKSRKTKITRQELADE